MTFNWVNNKITLMRIDKLGDEFFMTGVAREIKKVSPNTKIKIYCKHEELFFNNPNIDEIVNICTAIASKKISKDEVRTAIKNKQVIFMSYEMYRNNEKIHILNNSHILTLLCKQIGIECKEHKVDFFLTVEEEEQAGQYLKKYSPYITLNTRASDWTPNKIWIDRNWQKVIDEWAEKYNIIHLGLDNEPVFNNVIRLAGKTSIRECFVILKNAKFHMGIVNFLMHAANGINTPSIIIYGGYESPKTSAYPINKSLSANVDCSPCWQTEKCNFNMKCMKMISVEMVNQQARNISNYLCEVPKP